MAIVFCADQDFAAEMLETLVNLEAELVAEHPDYVDRSTPVILTYSQHLMTGVDAPTCKYVVLSRIVGWFNTRRLIEPIGYIPLTEAKERHFAASEQYAMAA